MLNKFSNIKPHTFFLTAGTILFFLYALLVPPFQTPDEYNHFYRAYTVSQGDFIPKKTDNRLGGMVPISFQDFLTAFGSSNSQSKSKVSKEDVLRSFTVACESDRLEFKDFPNTCYYSPVSYLPQSLTLYVCQKLNTSVGSMYYAGRTTIFIVWLMVIFYSIKIIPVGKWVLVFVNLLPMQLYVSNSFSADTVTNMLAFFWLALVLKQAFSGKAPDSKSILIMVLVACGLGLAKLIYVFLVLLLLLIPATNFKNRRQWFLFISGISLPAILVAYWWSSVVMQNYLSFATYNPEDRMHATLIEGADYYLQKNYLLKQPHKLVSVIYYSLTHHPALYLSSYVGFFGIFMDMSMPLWTYMLAYSGMLLITLMDGHKVAITSFQKWILFITACVIFVFLVLSQYLTWIKLEDKGVAHLQGRYLVPVIPLFLIALTRSNHKHQWNLVPFVIIPALILNVYAGSILYDRYFKENYTSKTEFLQTFEEDRLNSSYLSKLSTSNKFDGNYSLKLENELSEVTFLKLNKIKQGDWFMFEGMRLGNGGRLQIQCTNNNTEFFNWMEEWPKYSQSNGWDKLKMVMVADKDLDSVEINIRAINYGSTPVYFDNLHFVHKTY